MTIRRKSFCFALLSYSFCFSVFGVEIEDEPSSPLAYASSVSMGSGDSVAWWDDGEEECPPFSLRVLPLKIPEGSEPEDFQILLTVGNGYRKKLTGYEEVLYIPYEVFDGDVGCDGRVRITYSPRKVLQNGKRKAQLYQKFSFADLSADHTEGLLEFSIRLMKVRQKGKKKEAVILGIDQAGLPF